MSTLLTIRRLELWAYIGVPEEERRCEQRILASLEVEIEETASSSDDLQETVDYAVLARQIRELAKEEHQTLERLAGRIAESMQSVPRVKRVVVTLEKRALPGLGHVSITLRRP